MLYLGFCLPTLHCFHALQISDLPSRVFSYIVWEIVQTDALYLLGRGPCFAFFLLLWTRRYPYSWISILTFDFIFELTNSLWPVPICILTFHSYPICLRIHMYYSMYDESIISRECHRLDLIIFWYQAPHTVSLHVILKIILI